MKERKVIWQFMGITLLEPTSKAGKDYCERCYLRGVCDADDCARKIFPIDVDYSL